MSELPPDFELPPGEATLLCKCGFESDPFCFVEHLYRCAKCETIDRPLKVAFIYRAPACTGCDSQFERDDRIHAGSMRPAYLHSEPFENSSPDFIRCPKCMDNSLAVNSLGVDYQTYETNHVLPQTGDTIHARTRKYDGPEIPFFMWSPRLSSDYSLSYEITNVDASTIDNGHHEFRIAAVSDSEPRLLLEYIRMLESDEWKWYAGPHGVAT